LPELPAPPTFNIQLGSYCNNMVACGYGTDGGGYSPAIGTPRSYFGGTISGIPSGDAGLRHGWANNSGGNSALLFSYFDLTGLNNGTATLTDNLTVTSVNPLNSTQKTGESGAGRPYNAQDFLVGGSRVATLDNVNNATLMSTGTINLVGPLTVGFEVQTDTLGGAPKGLRRVINSGTITDATEKTDSTVQGILAPGSTINLDSADFGSGSSKITVKNTDGFLGYKVGMILTLENQDTYSDSVYNLTNDGTINFGGEKSIVAIGKTSRSKIYPYDKVDKLVSIGNISNLNLEKVVEYKPDLIVVSSMMLRNVDAVKKMGYNIIVSNASSLDGILDTISVTGVISGKKEEAEKLRKECLIKLERIEKENSKKTSKLKGAILFSTSPMIAFSEDSIPGDVLKHLGVINIAANVPGQRPILSPEYILKENPDFLAGAMSLDNPKQIIEASNVIPKTKAGKNNNIFILDSSVILRSSYRIFDEMEVLKEKLDKIEKK